MAFRVERINKNFVDEHAAEVDGFRIEMTREDASKGGQVSFLLRGREIKLNIPPGIENGTRIKISKTAENTAENKKIERNTYFFISISEPAPPSRFSYFRSLLRGFGDGVAGQEQPKTFPSPNGSGGGGVAMQLKLKRSQRAAGLMGGKVMYMLDARAELTPEERSLVAKHGLGKLAIYDSEARKKQMQAAGERLSRRRLARHGSGPRKRRDGGDVAPGHDRQPDERTPHRMQNDGRIARR